MNVYMWYVEVLVADAAYHKDEALTYGSAARLAAGSVVLVPLQKKQVLGIVTKLVGKPAFAVKEVLEAPKIPALPDTQLKLIDWLREYYPAPLGNIVQLFLPDTVTATIAPKEDASAPTPQIQLPALTQDQKAALQQIGPNGMHILHGATGSGKTRVYVELAHRQLAQGRSSIVLTPEIGLTSQLAATFQQAFADQVVVMHSGLTESARRATWQKVLASQKPLIIVGARSAIFAPVHTVGLIVIDEAHETAYKQDQAPYYQTSAVAAKLAELHKATLVLGSATPLIRDYYVARAKKRPIIRMTQVAAGQPEHDQEVKIIDLKDRNQFGKSAHLSKALIEAMQDRLKNNEQSLLFLNRRGTARVVFCETCGWQALCPHCDLPLVYHGDNHTMRCHSCSHRTASLASCPSCKSSNIVFRSIGTKAIAEEVKKMFPQARVMRFDTDNKKSERLEAHYEAVRSGQVDIIVGTQTLAKGLDLPKLSLVGVVIADTSLYFPDFSAQERTYQLLSQVLGRIGRGHTKGTAIIQTYAPESTLLQAIVEKEWDNFYNSELTERRKFLFPPFCYLLKLSCKRASDASAQKAAQQLATVLRNTHKVIVEGPAPSLHGKVQNKFIWQLIVKSKARSQLISIIKNLPSGWSYDIDPMNLL